MNIHKPYCVLFTYHEKNNILFHFNISRIGLLWFRRICNLVTVLFTYNSKQTFVQWSLYVIYKKSMLTLFDNIKVIFVVDSEDDMYTFKLTFGSSLISGD